MRSFEEGHAFQKHFGEDFLLLSREEVVQQNLFGAGSRHQRLEGFLGDYLAIAVGELAIFNTKEDADFFAGVHAGMTEEEMLIPLIVVEKDEQEKII